MNRPGREDVQIGLFADYRTNVELYPRFQAWLRDVQPATLVLWGRHDPFFTVAGAKAFRRDVPGAQIELLDGSHFLLETHAPRATRILRRFLLRTVGS
jgi:pimeloyl-ACP methyl ester carboxylesterase